MTHKLVYISLIFLALTFSCGSKKTVVTKTSKRTKKTEKVVKTKRPKLKTPVVKPTKIPSSVQDYINLYAQIAMVEMQKSKIPASITLAQGILESGVGKGRLSVEANNHFGIKCHGWQGQKIYHDDDASQECFRKYSKAESSFKDHSEFLTGRKRYANLFKLKPNDYKGWAKGLRAAGYATDKKYPQKLISLIERYQLYTYDEEILGRPYSSEEKPVSSGVVKHIVKKGDTLYSLSRRYKTSVTAIKDLNNMTSNNLALGQILIIPN